MSVPRDAVPSTGLDALRRDLYRPGSTEADVQRYLDERASAEQEPASAIAPPRRSRRGLLLPVLALGAASVALVAVSLHPAQTLPAAVATTVSPVPVLAEDIGEGTTLVVPQRAGTTSATAPVSVAGIAVAGRLFEGSGNGVLDVAPSPGATRGGTAVVLLTSTGPVPVAWCALSSVELGQWTAVPVVVARGMSAEPPGAPAPQTFRYPDAPPTRIAVIAPEGIRWSVLVGMTGPTPDLH